VLPYKIEETEDKKIVIVDANNYNDIPLIEDNPNIMDFTIKLLTQIPDVYSIIFEQGDSYEYDYNQLALLKEIAQIYSDLYMFIPRPTGIPYIDKYFEQYHTIITLLPRDPISSYVSLKRLEKKIEIEIEKTNSKELVNLLSIVKKAIKSLDNTKMISLVKDKLIGYQIGDRTIYRELFYPLIKPSFMYVKLITQIPSKSKIIDFYKTNEANIYIVDTGIKLKYHLIPIEFSLSPEEYDLLSKARYQLSRYNPLQSNLIEPSNLRDVFYQLGKDTLIRLAQYYRINLTKDKLEKLSSILLKYTAGLGIIETILEDKNIEDISINPPTGENPIFVYHTEYGYLESNIKLTPIEAEILVTRLKLYSGRPLDEANPILDTELKIKNNRIRVAAVTKPLSPYGYGFSIRRHRDKPWTLPLLIKYEMLDYQSAALLSFFVEFGRTILIAGPRGAGKTSLLTALLLEIPLSTRIITIEDVLEIPTEYLQRIGYNVLSLKVKSPLSIESKELPAEYGIRASLRLGDSALVLGEVRSKEAIALFEAMRVGALAHSVLGTIHAETPYGLYDRVVNDLGVPKTSFKAVDIIVMLNKIIDGLKLKRKLVQITELTKYWEKDPLEENAFIDLAIYDSKSDKTIINDLSNSYTLREIIKRVRHFKDFVSLLSYLKAKEWQLSLLVKYNILEGKEVVIANELFRKHYIDGNLKMYEQTLKKMKNKKDVL